MQRAHRGVLIIAGVLVACGAAVHAQTFYKWTDEHGVVHLADEPPLGGRGVEQRQLPPPPTPAAPAPEAGEAKAPAGDATPGEASDKASPARVITVSREVTRTGPSKAHVIGEVKNIGGQQADGVEIALRTTDTQQGTLCLNEQTEVTPSTLPPGERGNFDTEVDSPCLAGDSAVDVVPIWK